MQTVDQFGMPYRMKIDHEKSVLKSTLGSVCSILMAIVIFTYAYIKIEVFLLKSDVDIMQSTIDSFFEDDYEFSHSQGLNFAIAFTAFDNIEEPILDPSLGKVIFNSFTWGEYANGTFFTTREEIESHTCSREELGLVEGG